MKKKEVYRHRIKAGARAKMQSVLKYGETCSAIADNSLCCITGQIPINKTNVNDPFTVSKSETILYQIKIHNSKTDQEALILPELLEEVPENDWRSVDRN
jgi:hypothetical protein